MAGTDARISATGQGRRPGAAVGDGLTLEAIGWERIQLVLRLAGADDRLEDVRLEHVTDEGATPGEPMPPTWWGVSEDGSRVLRFNVMLGPGQAPLARGTWRLCAGPEGSPAPVPIGRSDLVDVFLAERTFRYRGGMYRVVPRVDRERQVLELAIVRRRTRRRRPWYRRRPAWTTRTGLRRRIFAALLALHRAIGRRTGRRIVFTSDSHSQLAGNLAVVHDRMMARGLGREYELTTIFKPSVTASRSWRDRWRLPRLLALADVILVDDYQPVIYRLPPDAGQQIIQLWHASGAFKTVGYSRIGKPGGPSPFGRRHKNYTTAIVSGQHDVPYYAEAFGLPEERVVPTGIPRMDRFFDEDQRAAGRAAALAAFPAIQQRRVILFAPTFRGHGPRDAWYDFDQVDWQALHDVCVATEAVVIVKMHPFVSQPAPIPIELTDRLIDGTHAPIDVNDLLFGVDLLVTDYSSIVFEFATLLRPMLFFAYDLEEYVASRDFYVPFAEFVPGRIARTFGEVIAALRAGEYEFDKVPVFASRHRQGHRRARPAPMNAAIVTIRTWLVRTGFLLGSIGPAARHVLLATAHGHRLGGNLAVIRDELAARRPPVPHRVLAHRTTGGWRGRLAGAVAAVRAGYALARARVVVVDDYFFPIYVGRPRAGTTIVQTWHASGAFKRFGHSVRDASFGADAALTDRVRIHANYDLCLVGSAEAATHYADAFGLPLERFRWDLGIPRTDAFFDADARRAAEQRVRQRYDIPAGRRVVLWAPTFRGDRVTDARDADALDLAAMAATLADDHLLLLRLHPFVRDRLSIPASAATFVRDVSAHPDINELMFAADVLVTDYSSAIFEYSLLERPMAFLAPDLDAYEGERGFYVDYHAWVPGPVFERTDALAAWLRDGEPDLGRVRRFRDASFAVADGQATARLVDEVLVPALRQG